MKERNLATFLLFPCVQLYLEGLERFVCIPGIAVVYLHLDGVWNPRVVRTQADLVSVRSPRF